MNQDIESFFTDKKPIRIETIPFNDWCIQKYGEVIIPLSDGEQADLIGLSARSTFSFVSGREAGRRNSLAKRQEKYSKAYSEWLTTCKTETEDSIRGYKTLTNSSQAFYRAKIKRHLRAGKEIPSWEHFCQFLELDQNEECVIQMKSDWFRLLQEWQAGLIV